VAEEKTGATRSEEHKRPTAGTRESRQMGGSEVATLASTAGLIGLAALVVEPELLLPIVAGAGLVYASKFMSRLIGNIMEPAVKTIVKAGYSVAATASEMGAELSETMHDAVAEAKAEHHISRSS
jgi:hypothetical protein